MKEAEKTPLDELVEIKRLLQFNEKDFPALHQAAKRDAIIVFVGAGVSKYYGCKLWSEMAVEVVKALRENDLISFAQESILIEEASRDPRKTISICQRLCNGRQQVFKESILKSLKIFDENKMNRIYSQIYRLKPLALLTTNIDKGMKKWTELKYRRSHYKPRVFDCTENADRYEIRKIDYNVFKNGNIICLHGTFHNILNAVLTLENYLSHYSENDSFLKSLFKEISRQNGYTVFIGYGLDELDIIEKIYKLGGENVQNKAILLSPIFSFELTKFRLDKEYYSSFGVQAVPYLIDEKGYDILTEVLERLELALNRSRPSINEILLKIENWEKLSGDKKKELITEARKNKVYEDKLFEVMNEPELFNLLKEQRYFETYIDTQPKETEKKRSFYIPRWNVLPYLENISKKLGSPENEHVLEGVLEIINKVSKPESGSPIDNCTTWWYFVKILCNLPNDKVPIDIFDLLPIWLNSRFDNMLASSEIMTKLLPKFLTEDKEDIRKAERIIKNITEIKEIKPSAKSRGLWGTRKEYNLLIDDYWFNEAVDDYSEKIAVLCSDSLLDDLREKVKGLPKEQFHLVYESLYNDKESASHEAITLLNHFIKNVLLAKAKVHLDTTMNILKKFLNEKHPYFFKMAIFIISINTEAYKDLFWNILKSTKGQRIFKETEYWGDELRHLLENLNDLTEEEKLLINELVEKSVPDYKDEKEKDLLNALHRQKIYGALSKDHYFKELYDALKESTGRDTALEPLVRISKVEYIPEEPSQEEKQKILQMTNEKLADYLKNEFHDNSEARGAKDLSGIIYGLASKEPERFINNLKPFKDVNFEFIYRLLDGVQEICRSGRPINWGNLFSFLKEYVGKKDFWDDKYKLASVRWSADHSAIIRQIADLIKYGTEKDSSAFPEEFNENAKDILFFVLNKLPVETMSNQDDYLLYTINSTIGKSLMALVSLSLRIARLNDKKEAIGKSKWQKDIKQKFEKMLNTNLIESYTCLGVYLSGIYYLDSDWTEQTVKELCPKEAVTQKWKALMDGYLSSSRNLYKVTYLLMKPHYEWAIKTTFKEDIAKDLINHICYGYLVGWDNLDEPDCLVQKLLNLWDSEKIIGVIDNFWGQREYLRFESEGNRKIREKILNVWALIYNKLQGKEDLNQDEQEIASSTALLADILERLDDKTCNWLTMAAKYVHLDFNAPHFIEYLNRLKEKGDPKIISSYLAKIFLTMLETFTPDYDCQHIQQIVEFLYNNGQDENANKICEKYGREGYSFLQDIWKDHNVKPPEPPLNP